MKNKVAAIGIALMLLLAGMPFQKVMHFCNHQLYKTSIAFSAASVSCGMDNKHNLPAEKHLTKHCCSNIVIPLQTQMDYKPSVPDASSRTSIILDFCVAIHPVYPSRIYPLTVKGSPPSCSMPTETPLSRLEILRI